MKITNLTVTNMAEADESTWTGSDVSPPAPLQPPFFLKWKLLMKSAHSDVAAYENNNHNTLPSGTELRWWE